MVKRVVNIMLAGLLGSMSGAIAAGMIFLLIIKIDQITSLSNELISIIYWTPIILFTILFIYLEVCKTDNLLINYFKGNAFRKIGWFTGILTISLVALIQIRKIEDSFNAKYKIFAKEIIQQIEKNKADGSVVITNRMNIGYVVLTEGYSLNEESLRQAGMTDKRLAKIVAKHNQENDGIYLILIKKMKVVTIKRFPDSFSLEKRQYCGSVKQEITITLNKDINKSSALVITGVK